MTRSLQSISKRIFNDGTDTPTHNIWTLQLNLSIGLIWWKPHKQRKKKKNLQNSKILWREQWKKVLWFLTLSLKITFTHLTNNCFEYVFHISFHIEYIFVFYIVWKVLNKSFWNLNTFQNYLLFVFSSIYIFTPIFIFFFSARVVFFVCLWGLASIPINLSLTVLN